MLRWLLLLIWGLVKVKVLRGNLLLVHLLLLLMLKKLVLGMWRDSNGLSSLQAVDILVHNLVLLLLVLSRLLL